MSKLRSIVYDVNGNEKKVFENVSLFRRNENTDIFENGLPTKNKEVVFYRLQLGETIVVKNKEI